ncbi:glutamyl-tRNA(Gln) amidotransferase subunit C, mitochondrial [Anopheles nili]|uniref:glutamyl-tRNA(Gln) amidotransferase subunit C, mitochondrial n=1 Tax=Anopheles nili TaxID=185578 RepID=UPI00237AEF91|nr:glutamyl-tRNA(Gln) amidotransferase subunit C, mitochondrial [Anopheles nili]
MFIEIVKLNMLRGIASRVGLKRFSTIQATHQPPVRGNNNQDRLWSERRLQHPTKVPQKPHGTFLVSKSGGEKGAASIIIDQQTVRLLERLSLVDLDSSEALQTLQDSIEFASRILPIETEGVEPLYCVLEKEKLVLRSDTVSDGDCQADILRNASLTEEEYFVAPPGNIPLDQHEQA